MDIAKRDLEIKNLKKEIDNRRSFLQTNFNSLKNSVNENILLKDIYEDYNTYYGSQLTEKKALQEALENLIVYFDEVRQSAEITKEDAKKAKQSAKETIHKLKEVEKQIEEFNKLLNE